jgi:hypothetical protein
MRFIDPNFLNPPISTFTNCPTCEKLISIRNENDLLIVEDKTCPHCGIKIRQEEVIENFLKNFLNTQAISSANNITSFDIAVYIFISVSVLNFFYQSPLFLLDYLFGFLSITAWIIPLFLCLQWLYKHGRWNFADKEYTELKREVKKSSFLWLFAHILNFLLFLFKFWN